LKFPALFRAANSVGCAPNIQEQDMEIRRIAAGPRMSMAVVHNGTAYLAGQVADDTNADVAGQTQQILAKIDGFLAQAGTDKTRILSANIWLSDIATFGEMNAVWDKWVAQGNTPARATVEARLATPAYKVEIAVIAAV
jgi:enamine deaminase RidA (YjgF/YER057c/UK114 family)